MDIKVIDTLNNKEVPKEESFDHHVLDGNVSQEMQEKAIGQVVGLEYPSSLSKYSDSLRTLLEYAKTQTEDHSPESLKWVVRSLEMKLGSPPFSEDRIKYIARYAYLLNESKKLDKEKKKFERNI
jgi:hypothetical protein